MTRIILSKLAVLLIATVPAAATIRLVPDDYNSIQAAIDDCVDGDEVVVADGTYTGDGNRDIYLPRKAISIRSENGPDKCIIDCNGTEPEPHRAFFINTDSSITIEGFTIVNSYSFGRRTGAVDCGHGSHARIINCTFSGNASQGQGGAISCESGNPLIMNCRFNNNSAESGGAIYLGRSSPQIVNCTFSGNASQRPGGAIFCESGNPLIINCRFNNNSAEAGGAVYLEYASSPRIVNCTFSSNQGCAISCRRANATIINCRINNNSGGGIVCTEDSSLSISNSEIRSNVAKGDEGAGGGGIGCSDGSSLILQGSVVSNNICEARYCEGAGISCISYYGSPTKCIIADSIIKENVAKAIGRNSRSYGGGIYCEKGELIITNSVINRNSASTGGGVALQSSRSIISGTIVSGNFPLNREAYGGGGIYCMDSDTTIGNCTIVGNNSFGLYCQDGSTSVTNSILYYNGNGGRVVQIRERGIVSVTYSDIQRHKRFAPLWPGVGNISADPCFVESGHWDVEGSGHGDVNAVWIEGDYHLLGDSLCIDAGSATSHLLESTDLDGNPRVSGSQIDMGPYEFRNNPPVADAGPDRKVYAWIDGTAKVTLDAGASFDVDGQPLTYHWRWTIDGNTYDANGVTAAIELPVGDHTIGLIVNDGLADSELDEVAITVAEPMKSFLRIYPRIIHRHSQGKRLIAWLTLPEGITKDQIDDDRALLLYPGETKAISQHIVEFRKGHSLYTSILAFFDKSELLDAAGNNSEVELQVVGNLKTGQYFYGNHVIRIKGH